MKMRNAVRICVGLLLFTVASCKARQSAPESGAELRDLNPGRPMSADGALMDSPDIRRKKVVLIYYANDTYAPTDDDIAYVNKEALISKLRNGQNSDTLSFDQKDKLKKVAARVADDWNNFRRSVDGDLRYLQNAVCKTNPRYDMGLVVFRNFGNDSTTLNEYERTLNYTFCTPAGSPQNAQLAIPNFQDFRFQSQPLASPLVFRKAIEDVMKNFPMGAYRYVLISKSHGSRDMAIAPHLSVDVRQVPDEDVWRSVVGPVAGQAPTEGPQTVSLDSDKMSMPILDSDKMSMPILDEVDSVLMRDPGVVQKAAVAQQVGVSKKDYLTTLGRVGGGNPLLGMYFPIVFMEACKSGLEFSADTDIRERLTTFSGSYVGLNMQNIGLLYTSDQKGLGYNTVDFREIFEGFRYNDKRDFQDALRSFLDSKAPH